MKGIVFINQESGYLMIDLVNAHAKEKHPCILMTGRLMQRNNPLNGEVELKRIISYNRKNVFLKVITWIIAFLQIFILITIRFRKHHLFIVSNPPMAPLIPLFCRNSYTLLIFDVYIEKLKELQIIGKVAPLVNFWIKAHKKVLKNATNIFTLTSGMQSLLENYSDGRHVNVIPVWTDNGFLHPIKPEINPFIKEYNLNNKFVVLYSGNLGNSSGVEVLIEVAAQISEPDIMFVIIGDGIRKDTVRKRASELKLSNCLFLPWQEMDIFPYSLASASLAVVTLGGTASRRSIPSKLYNYMSVGAPVLCIADKASDLTRIVKNHGIGECFEAHMLSEIVCYIKQLAKNPDQCKLFSEKSLKASLNFTSTNALKFVQTYDNRIES